MQLKKISERTLSEVIKFDICLPSDYLNTFSGYLKEEAVSLDTLVKEEILKDYEVSRKIMESSQEILSDTNKLVENIEETLSQENKAEINKLKEEMNLLRNKLETLNQEVHYDELTACLNRKWIYNIFLDNGVFKKSGSVVFIDLNDFKDINDLYGHHVGDLTLKYFSDFIVKNKNEGDYFVRYAGDEFILFSTNKNIHLSVKKWLKELSAVKLSVKNNKNVKFSVSFAYGVFQYKKGDSFKEIFEIADKNMYKNKKEMKNGGKRF